MNKTAVRSSASRARSSGPRFGAGGGGGGGGGAAARLGFGGVTAAAGEAVLRARLAAGFPDAALGARLVDFAIASPQPADAAMRKAAVRGGHFGRQKRSKGP